MKIFVKIWTFYQNLEYSVYTEKLGKIFYNKLFIFKDFSKRIFKLEMMFEIIYDEYFAFDYVIYICSIILNSSLLILSLFDDCYRYSFKIGIFKQSYFLLFVRFKKRNTNWYSLLYL